MGITCDDNASGLGYIMYTSKPASARFGAGANDTEHFVCVRFSQDLNRWIYAGDGGAFANQSFTPESADFAIAQFEFGNASSTLPFINLKSMIAASDNTASSFRKMRAGYIGGDISIKPDRYNGISDCFPIVYATEDVNLSFCRYRRFLRISNIWLLSDGRPGHCRCRNGITQRSGPAHILPARQF